VLTCHSRFVGKDDYEGLDIPVCLLPSGGEDKETVDSLYASLEKKNPGKNFLKWYPNEAHGWCAARGDVSTSNSACTSSAALWPFSTHTADLCSSLVASTPRPTPRPTSSSSTSSTSTCKQL
jgi:hypothetical protein